MRPRLTPAMAFLLRWRGEPMDDGHPDGRDGAEEEDIAPPLFGWTRDAAGKILR